MSTLRLGIIGLGNMGANHARAILAGKVPRCELTAVCDKHPEQSAAFPEIPSFRSTSELIASGQVDAVLISTPHYSHTPIGVEALQAGLHVLMEKPISVHKLDCERLLAAHTNPDQVFAAMFNQRTDPRYSKLRQLLRAGELGRIRRISWTITNWFRTQAYYDSGGWRATWAGEGGGVLLNQCPHQLDLWQWLFGMPAKVRAFCHIGRYHEIEVEDDVTAYLEYEDGTTGTFITSTGEAPGTNRLEVAGDQGKIVLENNLIQFVRNEIPMNVFCQTDSGRFSAPPTWNVHIPAPDGPGSQHIGIINNFVEAILDDAPLVAPAREGIHSVELANAMLQSGFEDRTVSLPLDGSAYRNLLDGKIEASSFAKKQSSAAPPANDFANSFGN